MDRNAIKKYAVWARRELISRVSQRAALYEITADGYGDQIARSVHGRLMSAAEQQQRTALIAQIKEKGYEQVMEEIAYTWFNRFSALRFMEVNGYLPTRVRVFTDDKNNFKPQILTEAINMELDGLDMQKVYDLKNANDDDALFKYMIIVQCNALSKILPGMFQRIADYTELLFPDNLLREGSVVEQMIAMIPQENWTDHVQIIGWLYQYYNSEPKDQVFANLKKNIKITKENIPAATQLFTPDWIVRYMVENSLGRLWLEGHPNDDLKAEWKYYVDEAQQEPEVQAQLAEIRKEYVLLKPEDILAIDPCQGSGHILAYMFDVLVQIYETYGYSAREAVASIVEHNIWGLDIDERAAQLAYFSVMMKARQYDRRFFSRGIQPHVYAILESNNLDPHCIEYFVDGRKELKYAMDTLVKEMHDGKEYGSILNVTQVDFDELYARFDEIQNEVAPSIYSHQAVDTLLPFVQVAQTLAQKYHAVVTNPPYMSSFGMSTLLLKYIKKYYVNGRTDLFSVFIERCESMTKINGFKAMIVMQTWMFLSSYSESRRKILETDTVVNFLHLGIKAFEEIGNDVVQTISFVTLHKRIPSYRGTYYRLITHNRDEKKRLLLERRNNYVIEQDKMLKIPDTPFAYWISDKLIEAFDIGTKIGELAMPRQGLATGDNDSFLREWFEVDYDSIGFGYDDTESFHKSGKKYAPYNKGGDYRKWYGNRDFIIRFDKKHYDILSKQGNHLPSRQLYFRESLTWSALTSGNFSGRYCEKGFVFDTKGSSCFFANQEELELYSCFLNSKVSGAILGIISPTLDFNCGSIAKLPVIAITSHEDKEKLKKCFWNCVNIAKEEWDSYETSYDFKIHPLIGKEKTIESAFNEWTARCNDRIRKMKENERIINEIFIRLYGLESELTPEIEDKDVTLRTSNVERDIRSLISYAVGCMMGRFRLTEKSPFTADSDAIIPVCDDEYFDDDIVNRTVEFIRCAYGDETLEENLCFIGQVLGGKGTPKEALRKYFLEDFFKDHCSTYSVFLAGKRPIYWLFDSGKKNGFKCLTYMHRYQPDTIARIRTDYVHEQQSRYRTAIADLENRMSNAETGERVKLTKRLANIRSQAEELRVYEEKIHHLADQMISINLDDGVKVNYSKFQDVLSKIK